MYNANKLNQNSDASLLKEQDSMPALFWKVSLIQICLMLLLVAWIKTL